MAQFRLENHFLKKIYKINCQILLKIAKKHFIMSLIFQIFEFGAIMSPKLQQLILVLVFGAKFQKLLQMLLTSLDLLTNFDLEDVILHNFIF